MLKKHSIAADELQANSSVLAVYSRELNSDIKLNVCFTGEMIEAILDLLIENLGIRVEISAVPLIDPIDLPPLIESFLKIPQVTHLYQ